MVTRIQVGSNIYQGSNLNIAGGDIYINGVKQNKTPLSGIVEVRVLEGKIENLTSDASVTCGDVAGNVGAGGSVRCDKIGGSVKAGGSVRAGKVEGSINAGGSVRHE